MPLPTNFLSGLLFPRQVTLQGQASFQVRLGEASRDVAASALLYRIWGMLGWIDILQRYRRSLIGPFWLTLSMSLMVLGMALVYGTLLKRNMDEFVPFLAAGFLSWMLISSTLSDGTTAFIQSEALVKRGGLPLAVFIFRVVWRNIIVFLHNALLVVLVTLIFGKARFLDLPLLAVASALVVINLTWILLIIAPLCTRFRDLPPIVSTVLQLLFFVTPVLFPARAIDDIKWVHQFNPFSYFVDIMRAPLIGDGLPPGTALALVATACVGWVLALVFFARVRNRIALWI